MASVEKKLKFPDKSFVRYYLDTDTGLETLDMDDVMRVLKGSQENKDFLASKLERFTLNMMDTPPKTDKPRQYQPPQKLSDFNQKLKQASKFNPNKDKK